MKRKRIKLSIELLLNNENICLKDCDIEFVENSGYNYIDLLINKEIKLNNVKFINNVNFKGFTFLKSVEFKKVVFNKKIDFSNSTFNEYVDFSNTTFNEGSDFSSSIFNEVSFKNTKFIGINEFGKSETTKGEFNNQIYFDGIEVNGELWFRYYILSKNLVFKDVILNNNSSINFKHIDFNYGQENDARYYFKINEKETNHNGILNFEKCLFNTPIRITGSKLQKLSFDIFTLNSGVEKILIDE